MIIQKFVVGPLENNCFIISDEKSKEALVVDPGDEPDRLLDFIDENHLKVKYIVCTHAHFDHIGALVDIKEAQGPKIVIHKNELFLYQNVNKQAEMWGFSAEPLPEPDMFVLDGDFLELGSLRFEVFHTPGHSPGGICLYGEGILVTGDTLFAGSVGRTDLSGGDLAQLKKSFQRLISLPAEVRVLPGHGPETTIKKEKIDNFFSHEV
jgi:hydroxyacylglutathione hydrolase